jgi:hypothetical protein
LGEAPDRKVTVLRSRLGRNFRQLPGSERLGEKPLPAAIIYERSLQDSMVTSNGEKSLGPYPRDA